MTEGWPGLNLPGDPPRHGRCCQSPTAIPSRHHRWLLILEERSNSHAGKRGDGTAAHDGAGVGDLGRGDDGVGCAEGGDRGEGDGAVGDEGGDVGLCEVDRLGEGLRGGAGDGGHGPAAGDPRTGGSTNGVGGTLGRLSNRQERQEEGREEGGELHFGGWWWFGGGLEGWRDNCQSRFESLVLSCRSSFV